MTEIPEGWYLDPARERTERYWVGSGWRQGARVASEGTPPFPGGPEDAVRNAVAAPKPRGLKAAADFLIVLAVLSALAAIVGGIYLINQTVDHCVANPYNDAFGTDLQDCSKQRPYALSGTAVIVGGAIQAAVLSIVARLCRVVQDMRDMA